MEKQKTKESIRESEEMKQREVRVTSVRLKYFDPIIDQT